MLTGAGVFALLFEWNWFKAPIERAVSAGTGREFHIDGDIDVDFGFPPRISASGLRLANADWATAPQMLAVDSASFTVRPLQLLRRRLVLPDVRVGEAVVYLEQSRDGRRNWLLGSKDGKRGGIVPEIGVLHVRLGTLHFRDPGRKTSLRVDASTQKASAKSRDATRFKVAGSYKGQSFTTRGTGGAAIGLADRNTPYPLRSEFRLGATRGSAQGTIGGLTRLASVDLRVDARGESLDDLYRVVAVALPPTPPYHVRARLIRDTEAWRVRDLRGKVGDSDIAGRADVRYLKGRTRFTAKLTSEVLDLDDLAGLIGAPPQAGEGETASTAQEAAAGVAKALNRLFPDRPYEFKRLRAMDADVRFEGKSIRNRRSPIDNLATRVMLENGVLHVDPLNFGIAGGTIKAVLRVDALKDELLVTNTATFSRIDLGKLFPDNELLQESSGLIGGRTALSGQGNSFADIVARADGDVGLAMSGGRISNLLLELVGLDGAESVRFLFGGDRNVALRCAIADLQVVDGVVRPESAIVDTTDTVIRVGGNINLRDETLDVVLQPSPKDFSFLSLRSPLHIEGTFKDPEIALDKKALLKTAAAVALGALVAPVAALLPLIERGPGKNVDCESLLAAVERVRPPREAKKNPPRGGSLAALN